VLRALLSDDYRPRLSSAAAPRPPTFFRTFVIPIPSAGGGLAVTGPATGPDVGPQSSRPVFERRDRRRSTISKHYIVANSYKLFSAIVQDLPFQPKLRYPHPANGPVTAIFRRPDHGAECRPRWRTPAADLKLSASTVSDHPRSLLVKKGRRPLTDRTSPISASTSLRTPSGLRWPRRRVAP